MEDYICRDDFCHLHLSILTNGVFPRRNLLSSNQKMGESSRMLTNIFNAYKRVQSCLHSEIYRTLENKQNITCKLSVCRLPISFVQGHMIICRGYIVRETTLIWWIAEVIIVDFDSLFAIIQIYSINNLHVHFIKFRTNYINRIGDNTTWRNPLFIVALTASLH